MPSQANGREIIQRFEKIRADFANHFQMHERMAPFLAPSRVGVTGGSADGDKQTHGVYDSTMMAAAELMAHFIAGEIIDPGQRWQEYYVEKGPQLDDNEYDELMEWCDESTGRTLRRAASSSFYAEGAESLIDWGGFGTGCNIIEENPQPPNYSVRGFRGFNVCAKKTGRFLIQEGGDGQVDTLFTWWDLSARVIRDLWKDKNGAVIPENVQKALDSGNADRKFKVVHAIYPRPKAERGEYDQPWASCWVEQDSKTLIYESGYDVFPAACPRYHKTPGEILGRGRGQLAFPDSWTLNSAKRMGLEDHALKLRPPVVHAHDSVFGTIRLIPGGSMSVNTHGKRIQDAAMPWQTGSNPEVSNIKEEELRKSIQQIFYVQHILALMEINKSEMTAFEYSKKLALLYKLIGPVYARADREFLQANLNVMFNTQVAGRDFSPPPSSIAKVGGVVNIRFNNALARSQRSADPEALQMAIADMAPIAQFKPEILDWLEVDNIGPDILRDRGVPARWNRNAASVAKLREERAKQDQKQLALDQAEQGASAIGKAKPALDLLKGGMAGAGKQ